MRPHSQKIIQCFGGGLFLSVSTLIATTTTPTQSVERECKKEENQMKHRHRDYNLYRLLVNQLENAVFPFFNFFNKSVAFCEQVAPKSITSSSSSSPSPKSPKSQSESKSESITKIIEDDIYQDNTLYERIDLKMKTIYGDFTKDHLIHESLNAEDKLADMKVYRNIETNEVIVTCKMGNKISGHPGIVHGGSTAALLDNSFGYGFFATNVGNGFTANLNINYRAPISCGSSILLTCRATKIEGRKVYLSAEIRDQHDHNKLYVESTCLFITSSKLKTIEKKI